MTAWVLIIITAYSSQQVHMPSKHMCEQAMQVFVGQVEKGSYTANLYCIPQTKDATEE